MIRLSDAAVLIDLGYVRGVGVLARLAPTEVLDVVQDECEDARQPRLLDEVRASGIQVVTTTSAWLEASHALRLAELSLPDRRNIVYAKQHRRILLATDRPLRRRCELEGVEVHGTLRLVEQVHRSSLVDEAELCRWPERWPDVGSRLPVTELKRLRAVLGC